MLEHDRKVIKVRAGDRGRYDPKLGLGGWGGLRYGQVGKAHGRQRLEAPWILHLGHLILYLHITDTATVPTYYPGNPKQAGT